MNEKVEDTILDKKHLVDVLGSFSKATGLYIEAVDNKEKAIAPHVT